MRSLIIPIGKMAPSAYHIWKDVLSLCWRRDRRGWGWKGP